MIIGIDETGDFNFKSKKMNLFIGAHVIDINGHKKLENNLERWKNKYRKFKNHNGEIKGHSINEEIVNDFIETVIKKQKKFYITVCGVIPAMHKKQDIQLHRDYYVKSMDVGIEKCKKINNLSLANQYEVLKNWYRKLSYDKLLKIWVLSEMIGHSFLSHEIKVILDNKDLSLGIIEIFIDKDFIRSPEHTSFWQDVLRNHLYLYTNRHPIPIPIEWPKTHPFFIASDKNMTTSNEKRVVFDTRHVLRKAVKFCLSHGSVEIQVADILATIISNYQNRKIYRSIYEKIRPFMIAENKRPIKIIKMANPEEVNIEPPPDPYINKG